MAVKPVTVRVRRLGSALMPRRQSPAAAGFDLCAADFAVVPARGYAVVGTGLALEMPSDIEAQVRPRSGLAARRGIGVLNSPGTIDPDYRGELKVILFNVSDQDYRVRPGDRIAQLLFSRIAGVRLEPARTLTRTRRGAGGFGHTGR
jgi:dUTP pyrophosphatase